MIPTIMMCDRTCQPECPACFAFAAEMREMNGCSGFDNQCQCMECLIQEERWISKIKQLIKVPWWKQLVRNIGLRLAEI